MSKTELIQKTIENISRLPEPQVKEIHDFAEFLLSRIQQKLLSEEISKTNLSSGAYKFLEDDTDLYTVNDLKVKYSK